MKILSSPDSGSAPSICPYLGSKDDPGTAHAFPTRVNLCYHNRLAAAIPSGHQGKYCLSPEHKKCPLLVDQKEKNLPNAKRPPRQGNRPVWKLVSMLLLIAAGITILILGVFWVTSKGASILPVITIAPALTGSATEAPTNEPEPTGTAQPTLVGATPTASLHARQDLETPIGRYGLVIHIVQEGENLDLIAKRYGTTTAAIVAINHKLQVPIWTGNMVVIPQDMTDVHELPPLEAYQVLDESVTVREIAAQLAVDLDWLLSYNGYSEDEDVLQGEWVLIPH